MSQVPSPARSLRGTKFLLFAGLYTIVVAVPIVLLAMVSPWLRAHFESLWWVLPAIGLTLLASVAPLIYVALLRRVEGNVLRDQRRYHRTLISASRGMIRIKDIKVLCRLIVHVVNRTVQLSHTGLFLYDPKERKYFLRAVRHQSVLPLEMTIEEGDPLVRVVERRKDIVVLEELHGEIDAKRGDAEGQELAWSYSWMRKMEARLIVPSFSNEKLLAFFVLGAKRSGEPYTTDDISVFAGLANQAALAIENAMFFEELRNNEAYMIQSEKLASLGQLASGMAHEIHNPLSIISGEAQLYLESSRGKDERVDGVLTSIIEECQRAADITRRILRFAKPAPVDFHLVDLRTTAEESLALAAYQVRLDKVKRTVSFPADLPKVRGNQNQLQEVFLNLILNACQAMGEQGGELYLSAEPLYTSHVTVTVRDTGPGIPPEKLKRVFEPFYTTKATGTGLGLFVCQRIVKLHGGTLEVDSTVGQGTTFTLVLPVPRAVAGGPEAGNGQPGAVAASVPGAQAAGGSGAVSS